MRRTLLLMLAIWPLFAADEGPAQGWISLFNGQDLTGWKVNENPATFSVQDGAIVAHGPRSHCFYDGSVLTHNFRNFELKLDVMTRQNSNGGVYILTEFQPSGWPGKGFEVQVNNTYNTDPRKTASLYEVQDVREQLAKDDQWFTLDITVRNSTITVKLDGKQVVNWTEPADWKGTSDFPGRRIGSGTIALQAHDPGSTVFYRNIQIRGL